MSSNIPLTRKGLVFMVDKNEPAPISEESIDLLSDARKGKARKFLMLCKGVNVVSLVVYKKGSHTKFLTEAKKSGTGQTYFGVVTGQGLNLSFQLAKIDGFEKAPVKNTTLKDFLSEHADLTCKPEIEIVDVCPLALDADDPLVARYLGLRERALQVGKESPEKAEGWKPLCKRIETILDQDDNSGAVPLLDELEKALAGSGSPTPPPSSPTESTSGSTAPSTGNEAQEFATRLAALKERITAALKANLPASTQIKQLVDAASTAARSSKFAMGLAALDRIEALLDAVGEARKGLEQKILAARPTLEKATAAGGAILDELKRKLSEAGASFRSGDLGAALRGMSEFDEIAKRVGGASTGPKQPAGDVLAVWRGAKDSADTQLNTFVDALRKSGDEYLLRIAEGGVHGFIEGPSRAYVNMQAMLFEYTSAMTSDAKAAAAKKLVQSIGAYREFLAASKFLEVCDTNELCGPLTIRDTLRGALEQLERQSAS